MLFAVAIAPLLPTVVGAEENFGEDPFELELKRQLSSQTQEMPWKGRSAAEVRAWAKENANFKLRPEFVRCTPVRGCNLLVFSG